MRYQPTDRQILNSYELARDRYALLGVDTDAALTPLKSVPISLHCWQGDDVAGFENPDSDHVVTSAWTLSTPASTASLPGSSAHAMRSALFSLPSWSRQPKCAI